jgi:hypothetical protein
VLKLRPLITGKDKTMQTRILEAHILAEEININRCEGMEITSYQTVRLCELLDIILADTKA